MASFFTPRRQAERELKQSEQMRRLMSRVGVSAKKEAQALAPRRTGRLARSIRFELVPTPDGWVASVNFREFYGRFFEFGTVRQPPQPFLRPGVQSAVRRFGGSFTRR